MLGLLGKKIGMSRVFSEDGVVSPVTLIECGPCPVVQIKTPERDGYSALQIGYGEIKKKNVAKSLQQHCKKAGLEPVRRLKEIETYGSESKLGQELTVDMFSESVYVNVTGVTKGRGFAGTIKRHNFHRGRETHGNTNHRAPGSIGGHSYPARVWPGQKLPGHYGNKNRTVKNLKILRIDKEENLIVVKGAIPGPKNGNVFVSKSTMGSKE